ncbi:penicillin acylase [Longispora fulva]|uniref:Acyl-homoserine lactone acylase PvdQ n=1 Tax=Longispora fulva TaxID=619741 RepID=A0A8J7GBA9_9ACTN|nr:penicillin acylase family protein [Longispora fulva]MBG6137268.1 acyl-homoserine lactone acylase PvdQ [Longispora fulva]GIG61379.1 penicillin acylase [Longispora fulva]
MRTPPRAALVALALVAALAVPSPAAATPTASTFAANDYCLGQCGDILPPGENGNATLADILANRAFGTRPKHTDDQLGKYAALVNSYTGLSNAALGQFFNDASFGVPADQVESTVSPRSDVTIVRDKATGVPHVYGTTRSGTEFGAGYVAAQDRLWLMDLFRHVGRGALSGFAGGAAANRQLEQTFWQAAPYTEAELRAQLDAAVARGGARGQQALRDATDYVAGINLYIDQSYGGRYFPGEYVLTGHVDAVTNAGSIDHFQLTDLVALASVVGALFGAGGGGEVQSALVKLAADQRYGQVEGDRVWNAFREQNDPEAVLTLHDGQTFPYAGSPANPQGVALPDPGSVTPAQLIYDPTGSANTATTAAAGVLPGDLLSAKHGMSNALVVSGAHTDSGHPVAVFGPQTGYFAPQLLMLEELHGPGIDARGVAFAGSSFYVQLGRGVDYSWSATSAGQDITDTYAATLCNLDGSAPTKDSVAYDYHGTCTAMDRLERFDSWSPTTADGTPAGSYKLVVYRTRYGLVTHRGTVAGRPVAFASLRSTYMHEVDSIIGFQLFNDPAAITSAADFQQAASQIGYTFNWFYADAQHTAYYNSGANPARPANVDPSLPIAATAANEWTGYTPFGEHPNSIDQDYYVSWNNKQARQYCSAGFGEASVHRANLLDDRVKALVTSGTKVSRASLTSAMADAAVTDLRAEDVLPKLLRVLTSQPVTDPALNAAVTELKAWQQHGGKRVETAPGSHVYKDAHAIAVFDAWWPLLVQAEFKPGMGDGLFGALAGALQLNESPSGGQNGPYAGSGGADAAVGHRGSAFQHGWWSYVDKDLRAVLGDPVSGGLTRTWCGDLAGCRAALLGALGGALSQSTAQVYPTDAHCSAGDQWCADAIVQNPLGGVTDPMVSWQNRPTYQQVVQFAAHRGDSVANLAAGRPVSATSYQHGWFDPYCPPGYAVDGDPGSRWASDWSDNQSITVDLGSARTVSRAVLRWESAYAASYRLQVSTDGATWRDALAVTAGAGGLENDAFAPVTARYVRMQGVRRGTGYGYSLYEFEVYEH